MFEGMRGKCFWFRVFCCWFSFHVVQIGPKLTSLLPQPLDYKWPCAVSICNGQSVYFGRILAHFIQERECAMVLCSPLSLTLIPFWLDEGEDLEHRKAVWEAAPWPSCGHREREGPVGCRDPRREGCCFSHCCFEKTSQLLERVFNWGWLTEVPYHHAREHGSMLALEQ